METLPVENQPIEVNFADLGKQVKRFRKARGMKQEDLADAVGISPQHLSNIENGKGKASLKVVANLALRLDVSITELMTGTLPPTEITEPEPTADSEALTEYAMSCLKNADRNDLIYYIDMMDAHLKFKKSATIHR